MDIMEPGYYGKDFAACAARVRAMAPLIHGKPLAPMLWAGVQPQGSVLSAAGQVHHPDILARMVDVAIGNGARGFIFYGSDLIDGAAYHLFARTALKLLAREDEEKGAPVE